MKLQSNFVSGDRFYNLFSLQSFENKYIAIYCNSKNIIIAWTISSCLIMFYGFKGNILFAHTLLTLSNGKFFISFIMSANLS